MELIHLKAENYVVSQWSGGTTTQIAIEPAGAVYSDRNFLWRVSSASVDLPESDFTILPDYYRWISTISGEMALSHEGAEKLILTPYDIHRFDGGIHTHSWGQCTDFNLMLRKEKSLGSVRFLHAAKGSTRAVFFEGTENKQYPNADLLLFCGKGAATVVLEKQHIQLSEFESVLIKSAVNQQLLLTAQMNSSFMIAEIQY